MPDNSLAGTAETMTVEDRVGMSTVARWEAECESTGMAHRWASTTPHGWVCVSCGIQYDRRPSADDYRAAYRATYAALAEKTADYDELREKHEALAGHFATLRASLATAQEDTRRTQRDNEELRGVIETYGRVVLDRRQNADILELRYAVAGEVFRAAGFDLFGAAIRECKEQWDAKLREMHEASKTWQQKYTEAFADVERAARPHATPEGTGSR